MCGSNVTLTSSWLQRNSSPQHSLLYAAGVCGCVDVSRVRCWVWQFQKEEVGEASMYDKVRSGGQGLQHIGVKKLVKSWQQCIEVGGDYLEK
jgi:hypothetical protein